MQITLDRIAFVSLPMKDIELVLYSTEKVYFSNGIQKKFKTFQSPEKSTLICCTVFPWEVLFENRKTLSLNTGYSLL